MTETKTEKPDFNLGIAMAGAVSGGAYTAGVFDFLVEALNEWQKAKDGGEIVPKHDVFISALSGTSAGGMAAALGLASLAGGIRNHKEPSVNPAAPAMIVKRSLPELYDLWVRKLKMFGARAETAKNRAAARMPTLLDTSDIRPGRAPDSVLNSEVATSIARDSLRSIRPSGERLAFFSDPTHLFLTHTNLDGLPYGIEFSKGQSYMMMQHEGRSHFAVGGLGKHGFPAECKWLETWGDAGIPVNLAELGSMAQTSVDTPLKEPFEAFVQAALTTGAYPIGLSARHVAVNTAQTWPALPIEHNPNIEFLPMTTLQNPIAEVNFVCVDGGAMNNEPFELVRWAIRDSDEPRNARDPKTARRAVLLIAPFPPSASADFKTLAMKAREIGIDMVGKRLIRALMNQARFKITDLIPASDPDVYSRFLISPSRPEGGTRPALASAPLAHFGGFLDEQFREHDFQLGRRNCQWFLKKHFHLDRENPVFGPDAKDRYKAFEDPKDPDQWPIIPLVGSAAPEIPLLPWPVMTRRNLADLRAALQHRFDPLVAAFTQRFLKKYPSLRLGARLSWWWYRREVINNLVGTIEIELDTSGQIEPVPPRGVLTWLWSILRRPWVAWLLIALAGLVCASLFGWV